MACLGPAALLPQLQALLAQPAERNGSSGHVSVSASANGAEPAAAPAALELPLTKRELKILRSVADRATPTPGSGATCG